MHRLPLFASLLVLLSSLNATCLGAQSAIAATEPSPEARCLLNVLAAEGFRLQPADSNATEPLLQRTLTGISRLTGMPDPADTRVQLLEIKIDGAVPGLVLDRAVVLRFEAESARAPASESARLDRDIRARLREAEPRCAR